MSHIITNDEPPLLRRIQRHIGSTLWSRVAYWLIPVALVVFVTTDNLLAAPLYSQNTRILGNYLTSEPKAKITAFHAIDTFTPITQENRDSGAIVLADTTPANLVVAKTNPVRTQERSDAPVTAQPSVPRSATVSHTIATGQTLSGIAQQYGISTKSILVENAALKNVDKLAVGDTILIPPKDYDVTYANNALKKRAAKEAPKVLASASSTNRLVSVRSTSNSRYSSDTCRPDFKLPTKSRGHNGYHWWATDISEESGGSSIRASADGVVIRVETGWNGGYGNNIMIDHGCGWQTLYAHLSAIEVAAGESVTAGEEIGIMGSTGRTIPVGFVHLHFEIHKDGHPLNPLDYLP